MRIPYRKMPVKELILRAQKDDYRALEELLRAVQKDIYAMMSYLVQNKSDVADLVQTVLIRISKNIKTLKEPLKFTAWMNRIVYNVYKDYHRKNNKPCFYISMEEECCKEIVDEKNHEPIEKCSALELDKLIKQAILALPEYFRVAIILREFAGLSYEDIAGITNVTIGTVKSRIARARLILQNKLKKCL